jgi:hypothetical protein
LVTRVAERVTLRCRRVQLVQRREAKDREDALQAIIEVDNRLIRAKDE